MDRIYKSTCRGASGGEGAITGHIIPNMPSDGFAHTLEDAKREFAATWRRWLAKTGREEETHRPHRTPLTVVS
jgi:hypothetical protein